MRTLSFSVAAVLGLLATPSAATNLLGQTVTAQLTYNGDATSFVQFDSPQTVGGGAEFTGSFTDEFSQNWRVVLDVEATGFTIELFSGVNGNLRVVGDGAIKVELGNLAGISPLNFVSYECSPPGFACNAFGPGPSIASSGSDASSAFVWLQVIRNGERYTFSLAEAVPEPATWAMMILGFGMAGASLRGARLERPKAA